MDKTIFQNKWISVKETENKFYYSERKGINSVAVFLIRKTKSKWEVLVRYQPLCIDNEIIDGKMKLFPCPITGTIEEGDDDYKTAVKEVLEESGYKITEEDLFYLTEYIVGTQTNERVYMFGVDVNNFTPDKATQDGSIFEEQSKNCWESIENLRKYDYVACQLAYYKLLDFVQLLEILEDTNTDFIEYMIDK